MNGFEDGIPFYTTLETRVPVHFPTDRVQCQYCRLFCRYEESFKRYSCRLTDEWLTDVMHGVGRLCPLGAEGTAPFVTAYGCATSLEEGGKEVLDDEKE